MKNNIINIKSFLGTDIRTRSRIYVIVEQLNGSSNNILDLSGVEFISRSFADELISLVELSKMEIHIENASEEIADLLRVVKTGRSSNKPFQMPNIRVRELTDMKDVELFFCQ